MLLYLLEQELENLRRKVGTFHVGHDGRFLFYCSRYLQVAELHLHEHEVGHVVFFNDKLDPVNSMRFDKHELTEINFSGDTFNPYQQNSPVIM